MPMLYGRPWSRAELLSQVYLSQRELAKRARTHPTTIARAVRGEQQISAPMRARIVAAINARRAELSRPAEG